MKKTSTQILMERMHTVGGMPLREDMNTWKSYLTSEENNTLKSINKKIDFIKSEMRSLWHKQRDAKKNGDTDLISKIDDELIKKDSQEDELYDKKGKIEKEAKSRFIGEITPKALIKFNQNRLLIISAKFPDNDISDLYPKKYFPFLYDNPFYEEKVNFKTLIDNPILIHTVWRGINPNELEYIKLNRNIRSGQEYNIGYEIERGLTVYAKEPSSGISYASWFAPEKYKPTKERPNYLIQINANQPENGFFFDKNDEYIKTNKSIPSNQIEKIWEVYSDKNIKDISNILPL